MIETKIKTNEVLLRDGKEWLHFAHPHQILIAERLQDVIPALRELERLIQANDWYAAGFLSYEAASAFDPAHQTKPSAGFPYLWFGLYPKPGVAELPLPKRSKEILSWRPTTDRETYNANIVRIKKYIAEGRTYQVNYTLRL